MKIKIEVKDKRLSLVKFWNFLAVKFPKKITQTKINALVPSDSGKVEERLSLLKIKIFFRLRNEPTLAVFDPFYLIIAADCKLFTNRYINRYRRWLETCRHAKTSKSGRVIFFSFFRRVRATSMTQRRVENTRVHFWTFLPVSVKLTIEKSIIEKS